MTPAIRVLSCSLAAAAMLGISCGAWAQPSTAGSSASTSKPGKSFVDINIGRATYGTSCGVAGLTCQNNVTSYSVTAGNMFTQNFGAELSYLNFGTAQRAGGGVTARGLNLSAVGRVPLGDWFGLVGKVGATYGITHVNAAAASGLSTGRAKGVGLGYGVALDVHVARNLRGEIGWERHDFHFAGQGTSAVKNVTVGLNYTF